MNFFTLSEKRITTALLLAAGTGSRLYPLTENKPKCLTLVNGTSILERLISNLKQYGFKRLVIVTGHLEHCIRNLLGNQSGDLKIEYVFSPKYKSTNNIYSLWMARNVLNEPFLLVESDLVFDKSLLKDMLVPDRIASARMQSWMNGTCVTINEFKYVKAFLSNKAEEKDDGDGGHKYKTVNIYSISKTSWSGIVKQLDKHISDGKVNDYYETVFAEMIDEGSLSLKNVSFDHKPWYEIDTLEDLAKAEKIFASGKHPVIKNEIRTKVTNYLNPVLSAETFSQKR